ncbi:MAG: MFS transporter [Chloroflexota bacterium]
MNRLTAEERFKSPFRWVLLGLCTLTSLFAISMPTMALSVLFDELQQELGITLVQVGVIWAVPSFTALLMAIPGGLLSDRFGPRTMLLIIYVGSGIFGLLRAFATGYISFIIFSLIYGLIIATGAINMIKVISNWFHPAERGFANGVFSIGFASGFLIGSFAAATYLSPWLGGWRPVFILFGVISIVIGVVWFLVHPKDDEIRQATSFRQDVVVPLSKIIQIKNLWLIGLGKVGLWGAVRGFTGYLPLYLRGEGWDPAQADSAVSLFFLCSLIFVMPVSILSDRIGLRRPILLAVSLFVGIGIMATGVSGGFWILIFVGLTGFSFDAFMGLAVAATTEVKGVGQALAGTAVGFVFMTQEVGGMLAPIIGNSLEQFGANAPFFFWGGLGFAGLIFFWFFQEENLKTQKIQV